MPRASALPAAAIGGASADELSGPPRGSFSRHTSLWQMTRPTADTPPASGSAISALQVAPGGATYRALTSCMRRSSAAAVARAMSLSAHAGYGGTATSPGAVLIEPEATLPHGHMWPIRSFGDQSPGRARCATVVVAPSTATSSHLGGLGRTRVARYACPAPRSSQRMGPTCNVASAPVGNFVCSCEIAAASPSPVSSSARSCRPGL